MQIDLFQAPGEVRINSGEVRKSFRTSSSAASENGNCGRPHFPFPEVRGSADSPHSHHAAGSRQTSAEVREGDVASQIRNAMAERHTLQIELVGALEHEEEAEKMLRPYQAAFAAAHRALEQEWEREDTTRPVRLSLYTARLHAGHARYPFKAAMDEATGWRKRIEHELRAANAVIERLTKPRARLRGVG